MRLECAKDLLNSKDGVCRVCSSKKTSATVNVQCYFEEAPQEPGILGLFIFYKQETPPELKACRLRKVSHSFNNLRILCVIFLSDACDQVRFV